MKTLTKKENNIGRLQMAVAALLWGLAGVCVKSVEWGSMSLMAARSFISLIMLFAVKRSFKVKLSKANVMGALMMSATSILYIEAIKLTTAGTAIVLQYVAPILVFLYSVIFKKQKPRLYQTLITLAVFGGCLLSFADSLDPSRFLGNILGLASGFAFAGQIIIMNGENNDSEDCLMISNLLSFLICTPFMFFDKALVFNFNNIFWVLILGVFQYGLANIFFGKGIKKVDGVEGSIILIIEPVFNPIPVAIFCGEKMGVFAIIGSIIVIACVALYALIPSLEKRKEQNINEKKVNITQTDVKE